MINKGFLYGIGLGIAVCVIYPKIKDKLKPVSIKMLENVFLIGNTSKGFICEVIAEAQKIREEKYENIIKKNTSADLGARKE